VGKMVEVVWQDASQTEVRDLSRFLEDLSRGRLKEIVPQVKTRGEIVYETDSVLILVTERWSLPIERKESANVVILPKKPCVVEVRNLGET